MKETAGEGKTSRASSFKRMTGSIRTRFMAAFFAMILVIVVFMLLFNTFFLERFYIRSKLQAFDSIYQSMDEAASDGTLSTDAFDVSLFRAASRDNIGVILMDPESRTVKSYAVDTEVMERRMWDNLLDLTPQRKAGGDGTFLIKRIRETGSQIVQTVEDSDTSARYMEMWGILTEGSFYLMRSPLEGIETSAGTANRFLIIAIALAAVLGGILAYIISGKLTSPILQMQEISERMRKLDFTARYTGGGSNELAELGSNLNLLSMELESNISELRKTNTALEEANTALARANAALEEDIRRKEEIEEMRKEFISGVTHELKTPIAIIQGYAEGLLDNVAGDEAGRNYYSLVIAQEAGSMNNMVQKLLELNSLEFGTAAAEPERFDIVACINSYLETGRTLAMKENITVRFDAADPVFVYSDQFMCEEVFSNYFTNAVHHAEGKKVIDISLILNDNCVRICVFNTGKPIPEDSLDRIWDKFYKVDRSRSRQYGGSGIGLSIVKAIMELMGGEYGAENSEDGVTFYFTLPLDKDNSTDNS